MNMREFKKNVIHYYRVKDNMIIYYGNVPILVIDGRVMYKNKSLKNVLASGIVIKHYEKECDCVVFESEEQLEERIEDILGKEGVDRNG